MTDHTCVYCGHTGPDVAECDKGRVPAIYACDDDVACSQRKPGEPKTLMGMTLAEVRARFLHLEAQINEIQDTLDSNGIPSQVEGLNPMTPAQRVSYLCGKWSVANERQPTGSD